MITPTGIMEFGDQLRQVLKAQQIMREMEVFPIGAMRHIASSQ